MTPLPPFLFDLDGTLADTLADIAASTNHLRGLHDLPPVAMAVVRSFVGDGARALLQRALEPVLPPSGERRERAIDGAFAEYALHHQQQCTGHARLYPGVQSHLLQLRERGHALAIVTNKPERFVFPLVEHLGLGALIATVVGGDTLPQKKPDPAPLRHALAALGGSSTGATMVGDGLPDLRAGKAAGLRTVACLFGYGEPVLLRREGADVFWRAFGVTE